MLARALLFVSLLLGLPATAAAQTASDALGDPTGAQAPVTTPPPSTPSGAEVVPPPPSYGGTAVTVQPTRQQLRARRRAARRARARDGYSPTWALLIPGLAAFFAPYISGVLAAMAVLSSGSSSEAEWLFAPVVGPFVLAGEATFEEDIALFAIMGVAEAVGLGLIIAGLAINRYGGGDEDARDDVSVVPLLGPGLAGVGVTGSF